MRFAHLAIMAALTAPGAALAQAAKPPVATPLVPAPSVARPPVARPPGASTAAKAAPAIGCPSLSNLRILLRQTNGDPSSAAAILADPKADHLSCVVLSPEKVTAVSERMALTGQSYDCVGVQGTSVCHWALAGTAIAADPGPGARAPQKPAPARR